MMLNPQTFQQNVSGDLQVTMNSAQQPPETRQTSLNWFEAEVQISGEDPNHYTNGSFFATQQVFSSTKTGITLPGETLELCQ